MSDIVPASISVVSGDVMRPLVLPNDNGLRPAGKPDECFYCNQKIGTPHGPECVCVKKKVRIAVAFEIEVAVPAHWDQNSVEFKYNESSSCLDNVIRQISAHGRRGGCLCGSGEVRVVSMGDGVPFSWTKAEADEYERSEDSEDKDP